MRKDTETGTGLPRVMELLWGLGEKPRKGPKPSLSLEAIVRAAVELADAQGLAALSMSRVAKRLGVTAMALYRHVESKDDLLALMVDAVAGDPPISPRIDPGGAPDGWRRALGHWAWAYLAVLRRHPWTLQVPRDGPPMAPNSLDWMDSGLQALSGTGLTEDEKLGVVLMLHNFVRGTAELSVDLGTAKRDADGTAPGSAAAYAAILTKLISAERYPALVRTVQAGTFQDGGLDSESETRVDFAFGLDVLLDGVDRLVAAHAAGSGGHRV